MTAPCDYLYVAAILAIFFSGMGLSYAQTSVDGTWNTNSGSWGSFATNASSWSYAQPMRPASVTVNLNAGATVGAIGRSGNSITSIAVGNPGAGYTTRPTVIISGGGGSGARAYALIDNNGQVSQIVLVNGGSNYTSDPTVTISREVTGFNIIDRGSGYSAPPRISLSGGGGYTSVPSVTFSGGNGTGASATASVNAGQLTAINLSQGGSGYGVAPTVNLSGGGGAGASAVATVSGGIVTAINIVSPGSGYTSAPTVSFATNVATGTAVIEDGRIISIEMNNLGSGYTSSPLVNISGGGAVGNGGSYMDAIVEDGSVVGVRIPGDSGNPLVTLPQGGAGGVDAQATLNVDGSIAALNLFNPGQGFTSAPTVLVGVPVVRTATAISSRTGNSVSAITVTNAGAGYLTSPTVTIGNNGWQGYTSNPQVRISFAGVTGAIATANRSGTGISSVTINYGGVGYSQATPPTVSFIGGGGSGAAATAVVNASGAVIGVTITNAGSGYTSTPLVAFETGSVRHAVATATVSAGRLSVVNIIHAGSGYTSAPTITFSGGIANGGSHALVTPVLDGATLAAATITNPGGAVQATATAVRAANGTISAINITNSGNGYTTNPSVSIAAPGGIVTPTQLAPGGVGSYVHFNNNITGNSTVTFDAPRTVGSLAIGDWINAEDFTLSSGTGGVSSSLTFDMGAQGGGQSFLQKLQGDQDVIAAPVVLNNQLNARITTGRLTLSGGVTGSGSLVTSGNGIMTVTGAAQGSVVDLWLWNRGAGNSGAQVELGSTSGPLFGNVTIGNASAGTAGFAVLQLLQDRGSDQLNQIADDATIIADAASNRWAYLKLMGGNEAVGNIKDIGNALVVQNMESETVNSDAVLTLGGNNLDSYIGGFVRNRAGGSGTGTLGLTKNGTGSLTLFGGGITYTGRTVLNGGELRLINTTGFASSIQAAAGTSIILDATGSTSYSFDDTITGRATITKLGSGSVSFTGGQTILDNLSVKAGSIGFFPGSATLRGERNIIQNDFTALGLPGLNRFILIGGSLSVGSLQVDGQYGTEGSFLALTGGALIQNGVATYVDGVLESRGSVVLANTDLRLTGNVYNQNRQVVNTSTSRFIVLNNVNGIVAGSVLTLASGVNSASNRSIPPNTRVVTVNLATSTVELSQNVNIVAGTDITFTYSNQTDGVLRGESLDFADVTHDGRKFIAVTRRGTIHTSLNGNRWTQVYEDPASVPFSSITWTHDRLLVVGQQGRVLTSDNGEQWVSQNSGTTTNLNSITNTAISLTGVTTVGSTTVSGVTNSNIYPIGSPVFSFATAPDARILSSTVSGAVVSLTLDSNALYTATNVDFGYFRGDVTAGSAAVSNVKTAQTLVAGISVSGDGIPDNTQIDLVDGPNNRLKLTKSPTFSSSGIVLYTLQGNTVVNNTTINGLTNTHGLVVGMTLRGNSVAPGATITSINAGAGTLTMSLPAVATANAVPLSIFTVRTVSGNLFLEDVTAAGSYNPGMVARGVAIPTDTYVTDNSANSLTLSRSATANTTVALPATLIGSRTLFRRLGTFTQGNRSVTGVSSTVGLVVGMPVVLPGVVPPGTRIEAIPSANTLTLTQEASTLATSTQFMVGFDLISVGDAGAIMVAAGGNTGSWVSVTNPAGSTAVLNSVAWAPSSVLFAAVGSNGLMMRSNNGFVWTRQTPPLADVENVITAVDSANRQITLNNNAVVSATNVSFAAFKASTTLNSPTIASINGMGALRDGMLITTPTGFQPGTTIRSTNPAAFTMELSTTATATIAQAPLQTFTGLVTNGSNVINDVTDFKGLMPGMLLHGTVLSNPVTIVSINRNARTITVASAFTQNTRSGFGVMYGDITANSTNVSSIRLVSSGQTLSGASAHLTSGRSLGSVSGIIDGSTSISSYSLSSNVVTLSSPATGSGYVPLLTFSGVTTNGSNVIENVPVTNLTGVSTGMQIYVTGAADSTTAWQDNTFTITGIATNAGVSTITLSAAPLLNATGNATTVPLGVFTGLATLGQTQIRSISNRIGELPPVLYLPDMRKVAWLGSQFVAVGDYGAILTSPDGTTWSIRDSTTARDLYAISQVGTRLLAAGENGLIVSSTNSGSSWTSVRAADSPALNDFRAIETIRAVTTAPTSGARVFVYGNGGLASNDTAGANWSTSLADTFSGTSNTLTLAGRVGGAGFISIVNEVTTSATTSPAGGVLINRNNTNRIGDSVTLESKGGMFEYRVNTADNTAFSETIAGLSLNQGQIQLRTFRAGETNGTSTLTFGFLENKPGATIDFQGWQNVSGSRSIVTGSVGENTRNRVLFTNAPTLDDGILGGWATIDNEWATYGANGITRLPSASYNANDQNSWVSSNNVKMLGGRTLTANRVVNSLNIQGQTLNLNGRTLSIESGGLLVHTGTATIQGNSSNAVGGIVTVGAGINQSPVLNIINSAQLNMNTEIADFNTSIQTGGATALASTIINMGNLSGLTVGMEVSGVGAAAASIAPGTRIQSIDTDNSRITLTVPTTGAVASGASLAFKGGAVSLAKSGGGLLVLGGSNSYTGKTYLNNGTVRAFNAGAFGAEPASFVADQIQINGGILQMANLPVTNPSLPLSDLNINFNDGKRGINFGAAGGALEVGSANPNNDAQTNAVPIVNLVITNPINAIGALELRVRSNSSLGVPQYNSLILGTNTSANVFRAGLKTEAGFEGLINIFGNNTIGGFYNEGGRILIEGNNNFTAPINNRLGTVTLRGNNTWNGRGTFTEPLVIAGGRVNLATSSAWGTGGINLEMTGGALNLMGVDQTIRQISGSSGTSILNDEAPDGSSTVNLTFDIDRNQTFSGNILDGLNQSRNQVTPIRLIKTGSGILTLNSSESTFSGGVEILGGGINLITLGGTLDQRSSLGTTTSDNPANLVIDKGVLSLAPSFATTSDRSLTIGSGANAATLVANGISRSATVTLGQEFRDVISGTYLITTPIAFKGAGPRTLTLSGTGIGDNSFMIELQDSAVGAPSGLFKAGSGRWVLGKAAPFTGLTTVQEGTLVVDKNDALGTSGIPTTVSDSTFTGNLPNGTPVYFPLFATRTAPSLTTLASSVFSGDFPNDTPIFFPLNAGTVLPEEIFEDTQYYVVQATGSTFRISSSPRGSPITLSSNGVNVKVSAASILPSGLRPDTLYYVVESTGSTFKVSQTLNGPAISLSSKGVNVQVVPKIDNFRSTSYDLASNRFSGRIPNGATVAINTKSIAGVSVVTPGGLTLRSSYYVVNSNGSSFQLSETQGGPPVVFTSEGTPNSLYYVTNATGNSAAGVNLVGGTLEFKDVNYLAPEVINFEGGALNIPAKTRSSLSGDLNVNAPSSRISVGVDANLRLDGNILGYHGINQEGEGTLTLTGESLAASTGANGNREWAVRAGTLVLEYSQNNFSKLVDASPLRLGGTRRGGTLVLSGGNHEEIVSQTILESGASKIYRTNGASTLRLNSLNRLTGSTLYIDGGRIAKSDQPNLNNGVLGTTGIMGAWSVIRDAITNAYWVIPGTTELNYFSSVDVDNDLITTTSAHVITRDSVVTFTSSGVLPGGILSGVPYYVIDTNGTNRVFRISTAVNGQRVNITSAGTGTLAVKREQGFQANATSDLFTTFDGHGLANGVRVRVRSYGVLPIGLSPDTDYWVVRAQSRSFRLSHTRDGSPLSISTNGTGPHVIQTQGLEKRVGPAALTFQVNPDFLPASDGNDKVRVAIVYSTNDGPITSTLSGQGTSLDPYIYTITTTPRGIPEDIDRPAPDTNSTNAIVTYVNTDVVAGKRIAEIIKAIPSPSLSSGISFSEFLRMPDNGGYGAPTALAFGTYDDGRQELSWAKNGGIPGSPSTLDDGFIMPFDGYGSGWDANINTDVQDNIGLAAIRNTFSLRFANQASYTVNLLNNGVNSIRTGAILVSPSVAANDSFITGTGRITTENQGNIQNLLFQQHNTSGSLILNNSISDRAAFDRTGYLTADNRRNLYLSDLSGLGVGWTVSGTGVTAGSVVVQIDPDEQKVVLDRNTDNVFRTGQTYVFTSPDGASSINKVGEYSNPGRRILAGIANPSDPTKTGTEGLTVGMVITGPGITNPTSVLQIIDGHSIKLSRDHDGNYRRADYAFTDGGSTSLSRRASTGSNDRRIVLGVVRALSGNTPPTLVSTTDLYVGMPISGPGIPFGSTITFIYNESDIQVSTNHFFTGDRKVLRFTPSIGLEKLGAGTLALTGSSSYTGVTFIADGTLRVGQLTDGGVSGSLGASSGASSNLVFNGGSLQYVGDTAQTNRGFTVAEFARINIGHERTLATFSGVISSGQDRLEKDGPGTLVLNGNANLSAYRIQQGRLLLQSIDTNPAPGTFSPTNFSTGGLTQLVLSGGTLEVRGTPEGNVTQTLGTQMLIEAGASKVVATSVSGFDPNNLTIPTSGRNMVLNLMGQEELTSVIRKAGGTVHFLENPESGAGSASIFLITQGDDRARILPWATYQAGNEAREGVNHFASIELGNGAVQSADVASLYSGGPNFLTPNGWASSRSSARNISPTEDSVRINGGFVGFSGQISVDRFVNVLRYENSATSNLVIDAGRTLELVNGAILVPTSVRDGAKSITGPGTLTGGAQNDTNSDLIIHNYNRSAAFNIGVNIVDRTIRSNSTTNQATGLGSIKQGEVVIQLIRTGLSSDFFSMVRPGMAISGPGIDSETFVVSSDVAFRRIVLSKPALETRSNEVYTFKDTVNFIQTGLGTTILSGMNSYTGNTYVHGGVLRLDSAAAVPGGLGSTGGASSIIVHGGVIGLGYEDFERPLGTGVGAVRFSGSGGFAAYNADRAVNIGGEFVSEPLRFGNNGFVPDGASLLLGSHDATHKVTFINPIDLSAFSQAIRVEDGPAFIEAELGGPLSGLGRLIKFGLGALRLGVSNTHSGGLEVAEGKLIVSNAANVLGLSSGALRMGTSLTNTESGAALEVEMEGGAHSNRIEFGSINSRGAEWTQGGIVDNPPDIPGVPPTRVNVGQELSFAIVDGYPAIAYYDATNQDLKYVRALDTRGSNWGVPVVVASRGNVGRNPSLTVINGNPAISFYDETAGMLLYSRSSDAQGVVWGSPISVLGQAVTVLCVAPLPDGKVLVGGAFTNFDGAAVRRLVRLNQDGSMDSTFDANIMNGEVRAILPQDYDADGTIDRILVGGTFTAVRVDKNSTSDLSRNRLVRLNSDGTLDSSITLSANGDVRIISAQQDGKVLVGGSFTSLNGASRARLARLNANGVLDTSFGNPDIRNGEVRAVIPEDDNLDGTVDSYVVGGSFTDIGGATRNRLARLSSSGGRLGYNPDANNTVFDIVPQPDGKMLVAGAFTNFAGGVVARTRLARLQNDGSVDETFAQEVNAEVRDLHLQSNGQVLVAGIFTQIGDSQRRFVGRLNMDGTVDASFDLNPDAEIRHVTQSADGRIIVAGLFTQIGSVGQQFVGKLLVSGAADPSFNLRKVLDWGRRSSLAFVNGNPAIAFQDTAAQDIYYVRSSDSNGAGWGNPELIESQGELGSNLVLKVANIGGDLISKNNFSNADSSDDTAFISGVANIGTPLIVYSNTTSNTLRYVVGLNANGNALAPPLSNWSTPLNAATSASDHFAVELVDLRPAIVWLDPTANSLRYIRATTASGFSSNLRDPETLENTTRLVSDLTFLPAWTSPIGIDSGSGVGLYPSLAIINGQPTTSKGRPAVSYYSASSGDLKLVSAADDLGAAWASPMTLVSSGDVGLHSKLLMTSDSQPAVAYYNATTLRANFLVANNASGYSRMSFLADTTVSGNVSLAGSAILSPQSGVTAQFSGQMTGDAGLRLAGEGILRVLNSANAYGAGLAGPSVSNPQGASINGATIIRSGTLIAGSTGSLGQGVVEMGDSVPQDLTVERATIRSITQLGGSFASFHDGLNVTDNSIGAFLDVSATIDGKYYGLYATAADPATRRFTGNVSNGTRIVFYFSTSPLGVVGGQVYFVRGSTGTTFQVATTLDGPAINIQSTGSDVFYQLADALDARILVKDELNHPERNGVYRVLITNDSFNRQIGRINLGRVSSMDSVDEMKVGTVVRVQSGTASATAYFIASRVSDLNVSAVHWVKDVINPSASLFLGAENVSLSNPIDLNSRIGSGSMTLGALPSVTSGTVHFSGPIVMQNIAAATRELQTLQLSSSTQTGLGVRFSGVISESNGGTTGTTDMLSLVKTGSGVVTLGANNTFTGGVMINQGTLLVMNNPVDASSSGTGSGSVQVNAGAVLGGVGTLSGPVALAGAAGQAAVLRPGDPSSAASPEEVLTLRQPLTVGADSIVEFKLGVNNITRLVGTSIQLATATSQILVQLEEGFLPSSGQVFDLMDFTNLSVFGGASNLLNLLLLPVEKVWDTTQFLSQGRIVALEDAEPAQITTNPTSQVVQQGQQASFTVAYTGTAPLSIQWMKDGNAIPGANEATYIIPKANQSHEGSYTVRVANPLNPSGALSAPATLQVDWPISILSNLSPTSRGSVDDPMTFRVIVEGESPSFQWFKNDEIIPEATQSTYTINSVQPNDVGSYKLRITGPFNPLPGVFSTTSVFSLATGAALVLDNPQSQTILAGTNVVLSARAGGDRNQRVVQWRRNGAQILGEDTDTLSLPAITLAQAGEYTFRVDNRVGTSMTNATSLPAQVVVVDNSGWVNAGQLGGTVRLTVNLAHGSKVRPAFKWRKNGIDIPERGFGGRYTGTTTKTLSIAKLELTDADVFSCEVTGAVGTLPVVGGTQQLHVFNATPVVIKTNPPPVGMVGASYSWKIPVSSDLAPSTQDPFPGRSVPQRYSVTGLPPGLKVDSVTGVISGRPLAASRLPAGYPITITVSNSVRGTPEQIAAGKWATVIDIKALPVGVVGVYAGPVARHAMLNNGMGGRFDMTVASTGGISGKLVLGTQTLPFTGAFDLEVNPLTGVLNRAITARIPIAATRTSPSFILDFGLTITPATVADSPPVTIISDGQITARTGTMSFEAWRNNFAARAVSNVSIPATAYLGLYNFAFALPQDSDLAVNDGRVPQGAGFASMTVAAAGTYTLSGRSADGERLTGSAWVGPQGQCFIYQSLYTTTTKGSLLGTFDIVPGATPADNDIQGRLDWTRPANPAATHRLYKSGFGLSGTPVTAPVPLDVFGGRYLVPAATGTMFDLNPAVPGPVNISASLTFAENRKLIGSIAMDDPTNYNPNLAGITVKARSVVTPLPSSLAKTTLSPVHNTGAFSGNFAIQDNNRLIRRSTFQGLMIRVRSLGGTDMVGLGYFILDQRPVAAERPTSTPQRSGIVQFQN